MSSGPDIDFMLARAPEEPAEDRKRHAEIGLDAAPALDERLPRPESARATSGRSAPTWTPDLPRAVGVAARRDHRRGRLAAALVLDREGPGRGARHGGDEAREDLGPARPGSGGPPTDRITSPAFRPAVRGGRSRDDRADPRRARSCRHREGAPTSPRSYLRVGRGRHLTRRRSGRRGRPRRRASRARSCANRNCDVAPPRRLRAR